MGITGLLPFIKNSCRSANLRDFSGVTVAIDAYSWLHKGAFACAEKLVKGEKTDGYVHYCVKLLNMLLDVGVKPIMVFDGCNLHSKEGTEKKRRENREKTRQRGKELLCEGKLREARECFQRCVDVTPEMAREVVEMCKKKSIDCIVAPYEADAQLAYLNKYGMAQIIITEDSDLVLFGCDKILFKMDSFGGGLLYEKENLPKSFGANASKFSFEKFRYICILSGCDYLPSLPGIGLVKACKFFMLTCNPDVKSVLKKLPSYLKMPKLEVTDEYIDSFMKANNTFLYQLVFCPQKKCLVPLNPYPEGTDASDMEYAGKYLPEDIVLELAAGNINVKTLKKFINSETDLSTSDKNAVWDSISGINDKKPTVNQVVTAFKFNSQKNKGVKRKVDCLDDKEKQQILNEDDEDLYSMYHSSHSVVDHNESEEDPLAVIFEKKPKLSSSFSPVKSESDSPDRSENGSKLSFKRVVKSRFFAVKEEKSETSPILRETSPENLSNIEATSDVQMDTSLTKDESKEKEDEQKSDIDPAIKSNKENLIHMFAKKTPNAKPSTSVSSEDITSSLTKVKNSWLDIIESECSSSSSTTSSNSFARKLIRSNATDGESDKKTSESTAVKIKKTKLIDLKILDFKWNKASTPNSKPNLSEKNKLVNTSSHLPDKSNDDVILLDLTESEKSEIKTSDKIDSSAKSDNCDILETEPCDQDELPLLAGNNQSSCSQSSSPPDSVISTVNLIQSHAKLPNKPGKCRQIGLSKNRKSSDKKVSLKDTLMNFNFVRKPKSDVPFVS